MIFDFKKSRLVYILLVILSVMIVFVVFSGTPKGADTAAPALGIYVENGVLRILYSFLVVIPLIGLSAYYADKIAKREHEKLMHVLNFECNPKQFLNTYEVIARKTGRYQSTVMQKTIMLALGHMEMGNMESAITHLEPLKFGKDTIKEKNLAVQAYSILCHCYLRMEDIDNANKYYLYYSKAVDELKEADVSSYRKALLDQGVVGQYLEFLKGNTADAAAYIQKATMEYLTTREQVNTSLMAALIHLKGGEEEKARDYFKHVEKNGKNLWAANFAREQREQLEGMDG